MSGDLQNCAQDDCVASDCCFLVQVCVCCGVSEWRKRAWDRRELRIVEPDAAATAGLAAARESVFVWEEEEDDDEVLWGGLKPSDLWVLWREKESEQMQLVYNTVLLLVQKYAFSVCCVTVSWFYLHPMSDWIWRSSQLRWLLLMLLQYEFVLLFFANFNWKKSHGSFVPLFSRRAHFSHDSILC